jgi:hypothetical protein
LELLSGGNTFGRRINKKKSEELVKKNRGRGRLHVKKKKRERARKF